MIMILLFILPIIFLLLEWKDGFLGYEISLIIIISKSLSTQAFSLM